MVTQPPRRIAIGRIVTNESKLKDVRFRQHAFNSLVTVGARRLFRPILEISDYHSRFAFRFAAFLRYKRTIGPFTDLNYPDVIEGIENNLSASNNLQELPPLFTIVENEKIDARMNFILEANPRMRPNLFMAHKTQLLNTINDIKNNRPIMKLFGQFVNPERPEEDFSNPGNEVYAVEYIVEKFDIIAEMLENRYFCISCMVGIQSPERIFCHLSAKHNDMVDPDEFLQRQARNESRKGEEERRRCKRQHTQIHPDCRCCSFTSDE